MKKGVCVCVCVRRGVHQKKWWGLPHIHLFYTYMKISAILGFLCNLGNSDQLKEELILTLYRILRHFCLLLQKEHQEEWQYLHERIVFWSDGARAA